MVQILTCGIVFVLLLFIFVVYGQFAGSKLGIEVTSLPMQILVGFFAYFIVMQAVILPVVFLRGTVNLAAVLCSIVTVATVLAMLFLTRAESQLSLTKVTGAENEANGSKEKRVLKAFGALNFSQFLAILTTLVVMIVAVLTRYAGWDTTYYIGEMAEFLYYNHFWTHDALEGGQIALIKGADTLNLHYAQSAYFPFWAVLCRIFHVEARMMILYTARALCVALSAMAVYVFGEIAFYSLHKNSGTAELKESGKNRNSIDLPSVLTIVYLLLSLVATASHSSAAMMIQRGYESKGYCAAVVCVTLFAALYKLIKDVNAANWRFVGLIAWASMPVAMSSMAIVPAAIAIASLVIMIRDKKFWQVVIPAVLCVLPNLLYVIWYVLWVFKYY